MKSQIRKLLSIRKLNPMEKNKREFKEYIRFHLEYVKCKQLVAEMLMGSWFYREAMCQIGEEDA